MQKLFDVIFAKFFMKKIGIIGGGSWGTALAITLSEKGHSVRIWDIDSEHVKAMQRDRENKKFLPGIEFNNNLAPTNTVEETLHDVDVALFAAPTQHFRSAFESAQQYLNDEVVVVNVAKGIEQKTYKRLSEIAYEIRPNVKYVVLSGPSHAEEVGKKMPTTVVSISKDQDLADYIQDLFITERFRVYTASDIVGAELGGAIKNSIALGAGISDGMGFGDNAKAALMTRGIVEMKRLGVALGADINTFAGLTGVGDLIVTCTSMHSRNRRCGILIGEGLKPEEATEKVQMVVEGMFSTEAIYGLSQKVGVEMPIIEGIYKIIKGEYDAKEAVHILMGRERKPE